MKTVMIKGIRCRRVKAGETFEDGDVYSDGTRARLIIGRKESVASGVPVYRPIKRATKPKKSRTIDRVMVNGREYRPIDGATGIEAAVCADIAERQRKGIAKYGTTVAENQLTDLQWNRHLYEELLDAAVYLRKIIANMEAKGK